MSLAVPLLPRRVCPLVPALIHASTPPSAAPRPPVLLEPRSQSEPLQPARTFPPQSWLDHSASLHTASIAQAACTPVRRIRPQQCPPASTTCSLAVSSIAPGSVARPEQGECRSR